MNVVDHTALTSLPLPTDAYPTRVYSLSDGRNAWHDTWSVHDFGLFATFADAARYAEGCRLQGTVFKIAEFAAVACQTDRRVIALIDRPHGRRLSRAIDADRLASISTVAELVAFTRLAVREVSVLERDRLKSLPSTLSIWGSSSDGGGYALAWDRRARRGAGGLVPSISAYLRTRPGT